MSNTLDGRLIRDQIVAAENDATINLGRAGEYEGPILIDRPVNLVGRGRLTTLWRRRGPVIVITAPDVTLSDLHIEVTEQDAPALLFLDGCEPLLTNVSPQRIASQTMSERNTIHLGTFARGAGIRLPFELEDDFPYNQFEELPDYLEYDQEVKRNRYMRRVFWLRVKPPNHDAYIIDSLKFIGGPGNPHDFHVSGVVEKSPPGLTLHDAKIKATIRNKKNKNVYLPSGVLEITDKQLSVIAGEAIDESRYCNVFYDDSDRLCLWVSFHNGQRVRYDGQIIYPWTKYDVVPHKILQFVGASQVELEFEQRGKLPLSFNRPGLAFGEIEQLDTRVEIELKKESGFLSRGRREFKVTPLVDWIETPGTVSVDRQGTTLTVGLSPNVLNLKPQTYYLEPAALAIHDENDVFFLAATINLKLPEYAFDVKDADLVFKQESGDPIYAGEIPEIVTSFTLRNLGQNPVTVTSRQKPDWLDLSQELDAEIAQGQFVEVGIKLNQAANSHLRSGKHDIADCVILADDHGNEVSLHVHIDVGQERLPTMRILNDTFRKRTFNLDHLNRQSKPRIGRKLRLQNMGSLDGKYRVRTSAPARIYLETDSGQEQQMSFIADLEAGKKTEVIVEFSLDVFHRAQVGDQVTFNIEIDSSKDGVDFQMTDQYSLIYQIIDQSPNLIVTPPELNLDELIAYEPVSLTKTITVTNEGTDEFDGRWEVPPDCQEWVHVLSESQSFKLAEGKSEKFKFEISDGIATHLPQSYNLGIIRFIRNDTQKEIAAFYLRFTIRPSIPEPHIHTRAFWFGRIEVVPRTHGSSDLRVITKIPQSELLIGNYGTQAWEMRVTFIEPWLDVPFEVGDLITVPADKVVRIPVNVFSDRLTLPLGPTRTYPLELESVNIQQEVPRIPAYLLLEEAKPQIVAEPNPVVLGKITSGQVEPLRAEVRLKNIGRVTWHPDQYRIHEDNVVFETLPSPLRSNEHSRNYEIRWNDRYPAVVVDEITTKQDFIYIMDDQSEGVIITVEFDIHPPSIKLFPEGALHVRSAAPSADPLDTLTGSAFDHLHQHVRGGSASDSVQLTIINHGDATFTLSLQTGEDANSQGNFYIPHWLALDPHPTDLIRIAPGERQTFDLHIHPDYPPDMIASGEIELVLPGGATITKDVSCG